MSEQLNDKQRAAQRLFGAMSGVDQEYLAACEADKGADKSRGILVFMSKYGKAIAAVLCLALLGIGFYSVQHVGVSSDSAAPAGGATANDAAVQQECVTEEPGGAANSGGTDYEEMYFAENESEKEAFADRDGAMNDLAGLRDSVKGSASAEHKEDSAAQSENAQLQIPAENGEIERYEQEMSLEEAGSVPVIGGYVPVNWPGEGAFEEIVAYAESGTEEINQISLWWSYENSEESMWVVVTRKEGSISDDEDDARKLKTGLAVMAEDFTREFVETEMSSASNNGTSRGQFSVFYQNSDYYVSVYFYGAGTVDQVWELLN